MVSLVAVDIGGTHARFALAQVEAGRVLSLGHETTLLTAEHASLEAAWRAYADRLGQPLPRAAAIAVAGPVEGETIRFTNNPWTLRPAALDAALGLDRHVIVNDFAAVAHAVAQAGPEHFSPLCGPDAPLPDGTISIVGPGTGLGVAQLWRGAGAYRVQATEGGHIGFAPADAVEDAILARLRERHGRVSVERVVSGPGLGAIYETLSATARRQSGALRDEQLWALALGGADDLAEAALARFCAILGSVAGDLALAHGAAATVIAGGVGLRLRDALAGPGFAARYRAKGRFESRMATLPVKLITHPQPGLFGAAAAFAQSFR